jgi:hypothetical protein
MVDEREGVVSSEEDTQWVGSMPKSKRILGLRRQTITGEGEPITPPIIFTKDPSDPRYFVRPGEAYRPYFTVPSRMTMRFIYVIIAAISALVIFGCILAVIRG